MKSVVRVKRRAVATFAATAMVAGGSMAVLGAAPASAATVSSGSLTYTCVTSLGVKDFGVKASMGLPVSVAPGKTVTPKNTKMDLVIPEDLVGALKFFFKATAVSGGSDNATYTPKGAADPAPVAIKDLKAPLTRLPDSGPLTLHAVGTAGSFTAGEAGHTVSLKMPQSFIVNAQDQSGNPLPSFPCTLAADQKDGIGNVKIQHPATVAAKMTTNNLTSAKHAKVAVKVQTEGQAKGTIVVKEGKRLLAKGTLVNGKKTLSLKLLKKGTHKVKVMFKGNKTTRPATKTLTIKVTR